MFDYKNSRSRSPTEYSDDSKSRSRSQLKRSRSASRSKSNTRCYYGDVPNVPRHDSVRRSRSSSRDSVDNRSRSSSADNSDWNDEKPNKNSDWDQEKKPIIVSQEDRTKFTRRVITALEISKSKPPKMSCTKKEKGRSPVTAQTIMM